MANKTQYGFKFLRTRQGVPNPPILPISLASGYSPTVGGTNVGVGIGDVLKKVSDGTVAICGVGDAVDYVCVGVKQYYDGSVITTGPYIPFNTVYSTNYQRESTLLVVPAKDCLFEAYTDDTAASYDTYAEFRAFIGENVDINAVAVNSRAAPLLDISGHATTNTLVWRIVEIPRPEDPIDFTAAYVPLIVTPNLTNDGTTGV